MKTLRKHQGIRVTLFPDNQPHVTITTEGTLMGPLRAGECVRVVWGIQSSQDLIQLAMVADAMDRIHLNKTELFIPYLMGARYDRPMDSHGSFDLKVITRIINSCQFDRVVVFDPHSDVTQAMIERCEVMNNRFMVYDTILPESILIVPDAGADKKSYQYMDWNSNISETLQCSKHRDQEGCITLNVPLDARATCTDRNCVIIDDLCDGGATFLAIAGQIFPKHLTLIVSHGIFSKGLDKLAERFDRIICSDSYQQQTIINPKLTVVPIL